jgi:2-polyprenyl-6-hydroxyphenyl methylase/3-demethylubiquinone-9 3-methyltransferase
MKIGPAVRHHLGRFETPAAELYRSIFINLDALAAAIAEIAPNAARVLEVGCGDGSVADRLIRNYPTATYVGIDIAPTAGSRFTGDASRATFRPCTSTGELIAEGPQPFDVVVIVDVLHHVTGRDQRARLLRDAASLLDGDGVLLVKDWIRRVEIPYLLAYVADRYVSGDATVEFMTETQLRSLLDEALPGMPSTRLPSVRPHRANALFALRAGGLEAPTRPRAGASISVVRS